MLIKENITGHERKNINPDIIEPIAVAGSISDIYVTYYYLITRVGPELGRITLYMLETLISTN